MRAATVRPVILAALLATTALSGGSVARAEVDGAQPVEPTASPPARPPTRRWYGFQTLGADAVALVFLVPAVGSRDPGIQQGFAWTTLLTYWAGGPIVHFAHGAAGKGLGDLGLRLATPVLGGLIGGLVGALAYQGPSSSDHGLGQLNATAAGAAVGALVGVGGAIAMDAALLAYEPGYHGHRDVEPPASARATHVEPIVRLAPERLGGAMATVGLTGAF